jgi:hypothetical protein
MIRSHVFYGVASVVEYFEKMGKNFMRNGTHQFSHPHRGGTPTTLNFINVNWT